MLVLSRKAGEEICIGDDIKVKVVNLSNGRVRIGIDAPQNIQILRGELDVWSSSTPASSIRTTTAPIH